MAATASTSAPITAANATPELISEYGDGNGDGQLETLEEAVNESVAGL